MEVILAGYNVPAGLLKNLPEGEREKATPEVISAAYARISRDPSDVNKLLGIAMNDVPRARRSNESIIYEMGHHSIADHVIFNLNITGVSRLLVESIEKRRLAGYTEKSQRYVTLEGDYVKPKEFSSGDLVKFEKLVELQNDFYKKNNHKLFEFLKKKHADGLSRLGNKNKKEFLNKLGCSAREDARYSLCLATEAQLGCSYTGQTAELAIRELKYRELAEEREFAGLLYKVIAEQAPSIIQLTDPELFKQHNKGKELKEQFFKFARSSLDGLVKQTFSQNEKEIYKHQQNVLYNAVYKGAWSNEEGEITLISSNGFDLNIIAALLHKNSKRPLTDCYALASLLLSGDKAGSFVKKALKHLSEFDKVPREFEVSGLIYEIILSASCFAQLKRHRMNTLLAQDYNPGLGCSFPLNIEEAGLGGELREICERSAELYSEFLPRYGKAAEYCLTNAHRRRVLLATNLRQLYHISRTREDEHAQWEIRGMVNKMSKLARKVAPITTILLGGKDKFEEKKKEVYQES